MASSKAKPKAPGAIKDSAASFKLPAVILVVLVALGAGGYFGYDWYLKKVNAEWRAEQENLALSLGQSISMGVRRAFEPFGKAVDPDVIGPMLQNGEKQGLAALEDELAAANEQIIDVRIVKAGVTEVDYSVSPPLGYAVLAMLMESEDSGKAPLPQLHFKGKENEYIARVHRVESPEGALLGHVVYYLEPGILKSVVSRTRLESGYAELQQKVTGRGRPQILGRIGDPSLRSPGRSQVMPVKGSAWRAVFWSEPPPKPMNPLADLPMMQVAGAGGALLLGLAAMAVMRRRRAAAPEEEEAAGASQPVNPEAMVSGVDADGQAAPAIVPIKVRENNPPQPTGMVVEESPAEPERALKDQAADSGPPEAEKPPASEAPPQAIAQAPQAHSKAPAAVSGENAGGAAGADLPEVIFRAYDIRGVVGRSLNADMVKVIGRAIGSEAETLGQRTIAVGRDGRSSSPELSQALIEGITSTGRDVVDIGEVPTPLVYFATHYLETGSGVMVTGSHNPPEYNGLKIMLDGETLFGERITAIRKRAMEGKFVSGDGGVLSTDVVSEYIRRISEDVSVALGNSFKVVIDCGNGVAGAVAPQLIRALGHDVVELYCEVDGSFPNHHPDPSDPANLKDLIGAVKENAADIGFAFDGDGDRLGVVDGNGSVIFPDRQMMLFARDVLSRNPGAEIIFDVKCSSRLPAVIKKLGGKPVMWKTGHSFIKGKLKETGAPLGGEMSGHIFFKERWYGFDDALYAAARMLEILMSFKQPPAEIFKKLPKGIATPELRVDLNEGQSLQFMEKFQAAADFGDGRITTIDGVRVDFPDGWGLVRASNTTPSLVLRFEGDNKEALNRIGGLFKKTLLGIDPGLKLPF